MSLRASILLGDLSGRIADETGRPPPRGYRQLLQMALDGALPGAHRINGRWHIYDDRLGDVCAALGMNALDRARADVEAA